MNPIGLKTLLVKEVRRFLRVPGQTLLSPVITTTLYFLVFGYSLGARIDVIHGEPYIRFIVPGLVFLGLANNAFLNTSSSLFITKMQGTLVDLLVSPFRPWELLLGFLAGGIVRGLMVGGLVWAVAFAFIGIVPEHPLLTLLVLILVAWVFAGLGFLAAVWAEKFEQVNVFPTFIMLPLTFLGGVFYSIKDLPPPWDRVSQLNPMVYMVEAVRGATLGHGLYSPAFGVSLLALLGLGVTGAALLALHSGYKLKQ